MNALHELVSLSDQEKERKGIVSTPREIAQQPETWKRTRQIFEQHSEALRGFLATAGVMSAVETRPTVILIGAGTSDYIGLVLQLLLRTRWGCETLVVASTDMLSNMADYLVPGRRYLWISFSRSGDSPEGVAVLRQAMERFPAIAHLIITCNAQGKMAGMGQDHPRAYVVVLDDAVNDRGLAMTSSFSNMVIFGQCLAHAWTDEAYLPVFHEMVRAGAALLPLAAALAEELATFLYETVCVVGSGALAGVAKESALKVSELTAGKVRTMSESVLGLRHGPMAALNGETLLLCFVSADRRRQLYEADLLREIGSKKVVAQRVVVGPVDATIFADCSDRYVAIPGMIPDLYRPPVDVMVGQMLGLYFSLAHGLKPDTPSPQGVISRVVGDFRIYE